MRLFCLALLAQYQKQHVVGDKLGYAFLKYSYPVCSRLKVLREKYGIKLNRPAYSFDLNSIEKVWALLKNIVQHRRISPEQMEAASNE
jgi:transposase